MLTVVDQAYFEYIDRSRLPGRRRALPEGGPAASSCCARSRRSTASPACASATPSAPASVVRRDGEGAAPVRPDARPRRSLRSRASATTPSSRGGARSTPRGSRASRSLLREHGLAPVPSVGNFVYVDTGGDANELFERLLHEGIIVRPLAGFGSPTAIRVSVGTPDELDELASRARHACSQPAVIALASPLRRQLSVLRTAPSFRLLFLATLGSGVGTWMATIALTVRRRRPHALDLVGERALHRHVPAVGRRRPRRRPAHRPALAQEADRRRRRRAARRLRRAAVRRQRARDRRARGGRRRRELVLPPRRARGRAEPGRRARTSRTATSLLQATDWRPRRSGRSSAA